MEIINYHVSPTWDRYFHFLQKVFLYMTRLYFSFKYVFSGTRYRGTLRTVIKRYYKKIPQRLSLNDTHFVQSSIWSKSLSKGMYTFLIKFAHPIWKHLHNLFSCIRMIDLNVLDRVIGVVFVEYSVYMIRYYSKITICSLHDFLSILNVLV